MFLFFVFEKLCQIWIRDFVTYSVLICIINSNFLELVNDFDERGAIGPSVDLVARVPNTDQFFNKLLLFDAVSLISIVTKFGTVRVGRIGCHVIVVKLDVDFDNFRTGESKVFLILLSEHGLLLETGESALLSRGRCARCRSSCCTWSYSCFNLSTLSARFSRGRRASLRLGSIQFFIIVLDPIKIYFGNFCLL